MSGKVHFYIYETQEAFISFELVNSVQGWIIQILK